MDSIIQTPPIIEMELISYVNEKSANTLWDKGRAENLNTSKRIIKI